MPATPIKIVNLFFYFRIIMNRSSIILLIIALFNSLSVQAKFTPQEILSQMTDEEKAATLIVVAAVSNEEKNHELMERWKEWANYRLDKAYIEDLIVNHKIGGVIFYGNNTTPQEQKDLTDHFQSLSKRRLIIALDIENSLQNRLNKKLVINFPCAMTLGAIKDKKMLYKLGYELGTQLKALHVHWTYGPDADVNTREQNPIINHRSFGSDPKNVSESIIPFMKGLQAAGIHACAKHFPGHGDTQTDSHMEQPTIPHDFTRLYCIELEPFRQIIKAGVQSIMTAHLEVPALEKEKGKPSSLSHNIVTKLLKQTMRFKGLVVTDALGMKGASNWTSQAPEGELEVQALQAGNDVLLCPVNPVAAIKAIVEAVKSGRISQKELDDKVLKVLKAKKQMFRHEDYSDETLDKVLLSKQAHSLKKELYAQAVTLAKSKKENPFEKLTGKEIAIVISDTEKNVFETTIKTKNVSTHYFPHDVSKEALTIFADTVKGLFTKTKKSHDHFIISLHDMNWRIDQNYNINSHVFAFIDQLKAMGKQVTVVLFGSPYSVSQFKNADNILVAYENDEDAQEAAAHVVCGVRKATGILPVDPNQ
jgi:beta-glucosidase-like glycosyl hydrolase